MDSIRKVFAFRLREKRGALTQEEFSAKIGIPFRSYQKMEAGNVPQKATLTRLVERIPLQSETELFLDPDMVGERMSPVKRELLRLLAAPDDPDPQALRALLDRLPDPTLDRDLAAAGLKGHEPPLNSQGKPNKK